MNTVLNPNNTPQIAISSVANLFCRMMKFEKAGNIEYGHSHTFDHLTLLAKGSLNVTVNGKTTKFTAPHMIYIQKDKFHELEALEDDTIAFCIHALHSKDNPGDILDPASIPNGIRPVELAVPIINGTR